MSAVMDPLRDEHATLLPNIERLRATADAVGDAALDEVRALVDESFEFLVHHLIPHARAEDKALYPMVQQVIGASTATATMSRDHIEVDNLTHELGGLRDRLAASSAVPSELAKELRRVLYGLYALVKVHFAKEEDLPTTPGSPPHRARSDQAIQPDGGSGRSQRPEPAASTSRCGVRST